MNTNKINYLFGWAIANLTASGLIYRLFHGSLTVNYFLFSFLFYIGGRMIQQTAKEDTKNQ